MNASQTAMTPWDGTRLISQELYDDLREGMNRVTAMTGLTIFAAYVAVGRLPSASGSIRNMPPLVSLCIHETRSTDVDMHFAQCEAWEKLLKKAYVQDDQSGLYVSASFAVARNVDASDEEYALALMTAWRLSIIDSATLHAAGEAFVFDFDSATAHLF
jgi:hypothetical protein